MGWHPLRDRRDRRLEAMTRLRAAQRLVREDLAALDEQLTQLRVGVVTAPDESTRADHGRARAAHESGRAAARSAKTVAELEGLQQTLDDGRYYLACILARRDEKEVPSRRDPCFFDPRHGPAVTDVLWAAPGGRQERVAACSSDAARLAEGGEPEFRLVRVGDRWVPWHAADGSLGAVAERHALAVRGSGTHFPHGSTAGASLDPLGPLS